MLALESVVRLLEVFMPMILLVLAIGGLVVGGSIILGRNMGKGRMDGGVYIRDLDRHPEQQSWTQQPGGHYAPPTDDQNPKSSS